MSMVTVSELSTNPPFVPLACIVYMLTGFFMTFIFSKANELVYTLDGNHQRVLMYHPLLSDGSVESNRGAYEYVEWDELDDKELVEADRCHKLLLAEVN